MTQKRDYHENESFKSRPSKAPSLDKDAPEDFKPSLIVYLAISTLCVLTFVVALDSTCLAVALSIISNAVGGTGLEAFWAGTGFLLCSSVFQPPIGSLSGIFGRKTVLAFSVLCFLAGCLVGSFAQNFTVILVGRAIQGVGGGGIVVLTEIIVCDMIPLRQRGQWFGILSSMYAVGTVTGPLIGGAFAQYVTWRWVFWINLPFIAAGLLMTFFSVKLSVEPSSLVSKLRKVDWLGMALFIGSSTAFILGISWGGIQYPWSSYQTLLPILIGLAGFVAFYFYEDSTYPLEPIVRTAVFKNRNSSIAYILTILHSLIVMALVYYLPLYYQAVQGYTTTITGVAVFPETFTVAPAAMAVGTLISKIGSFRWALWSGFTITVLGLGIMYLLAPGTNIPAWIFLNIVPGLGTGMLYPALQYAVQSSASDEDTASAVSMWSFFRALGQSFGVAVGGTVLQNQLYVKFTAYPALAPQAAEYASDAAALAQVIYGMPPDDQRKVMLVQGYSDALDVLWVVLCGLAGLGLSLSLVVRHVSLDREFKPQQRMESEKEVSKEILTEKAL